jgi:hypothetical protein
MKRIVLLLPIIAVLLLTIGATDVPKKTVFSSLKVGQSVGLKDHGAAFEINFLSEEIPQGHTVIVIEDDYVVLEDLAGVTQTTIPVYSLKAIVRLKVK